MRGSAYFGCWLLGLAALAVSQPVQTWGRYLDVTVNTTDADGGANVGQAVADFPLLLRLGTNNAGAMFNEVLPGGADLRFADVNGTELAHSIESWSDTAAIVWVRVPMIMPNAQNTVRMYWGKEGQTSTSNSEATFEGFTGVWHMNDPQGTGPQDATANGINWSAHQGVQSVPGIIGDARYYNQGQGTGGQDAGSLTTYIVDSINNNNTSGGALLRANNPAAMTVSLWANRVAGNNASAALVGHFRYSPGSHRGWALLHGSNMFQVIVSPDGEAGSEYRLETSNVYNAATNGTWHHVTATISATDGIRLYVNGVQQAHDPSPAQPHISTAAAARPLIGALERNWQQRYEGYIDEMRLSRVVRSAAWVKLDYETQRAGVTAVTYGAAADNDTTRVFFYPLKNAAYTRNVQIQQNLPFVRDGHTATAFAISPTTMPAGLSFNPNTGAITGTPTTAAAAVEYIVTAMVGGSPLLDTISIQVLAGDPPGAPTNVTATAGNQQAAVSWSAPTVTGTTPITSYIARVVEDTSKTCTWTTGNLGCTITGLTNGTPYTVTVTAVNSVGPGTPSAPSAAVTPATVPSAPRNVVATQTASTATTSTINISWELPESNGGLPITGTFALGTPTVSCYAPGATATSCNISNIPHGTSYTFVAVSNNLAGAGDTSAPSAPIVPSSLLPGSFAIHMTGTMNGYTFVLSPEAISSTEAFTMSINDIWGRTVWSRTVHPSRDNTRELSWNGRNSSGQPVASGLYLVRVNMVGGDAVTNFVQRATQVR